MPTDASLDLRSVRRVQRCVCTRSQNTRDPTNGRPTVLRNVAGERTRRCCGRHYRCRCRARPAGARKRRHTAPPACSAQRRSSSAREPAMSLRARRAAAVRTARLVAVVAAAALGRQMLNTLRPMPHMFRNNDTTGTII